MYSYSYRSKPNGAPILSRVEIEDITEGILKEYQEELLTQPQEIDIEHLACKYLHAHEDIQYLSPNGIYIDKEINQNDIKMFNKLDELVFNILKKSIKLGEVNIITNATLGWVEFSMRKYYPNSSKHC